MATEHDTRTWGWGLVGVLGVLGGLLAIAGTLASGDYGYGYGLGVLEGAFGLVFIVYGVVGAVSIYAFGELIFLLLAIEENTRAAAMTFGRPQAGTAAPAQAAIATPPGSPPVRPGPAPSPPTGP